MIRVRLSLQGRVQGVLFRAHAQEKARELGVTGWVANESDGSLTVVAEGPQNRIQEFADWCHAGPSGARVDKVELREEPYAGEFTDFSTRF